MHLKKLYIAIFLLTISIIWLAGPIRSAKASNKVDEFSSPSSLGGGDAATAPYEDIKVQEQAIAASQVPFDCSPNFYQFLSGHLHVLDPQTGRYEPIGKRPNFVINAAAYNPADNFIYATARGSGVDSTGKAIKDRDFIKIDSKGNIFKISSVSVGVSKNAGDIYNGELWAKDKIIGLQSSKLYRFNLSTGAVTVVETDRPFPNAADFALIGSTLYGGYRDGRLVRIDVSQSPPKVTTVRVTGLPRKDYGSAYTANSNELYLSSNSGGLYRIENYSSASPKAVFALDTVRTAKNDGASCPSAAPPFEEVEPETTPEPTPVPTQAPPPPPSTSCNNYMITGVANDPDRMGAALTVQIYIDGVTAGVTTASGGRFSFPIHDEFKDDHSHQVTVTVNNPYSSRYWVSTGVDANGSPTGYYRTVNRQSYAYVDHPTFLCAPPETDLVVIGEAWAKKPGRDGSYPNGDLANEKVWLEDASEFEIEIENKHPIFAALSPKIVIDLPIDPDSVLDWELNYHPDWSCSRAELQVTCTRGRFESDFTSKKYGEGSSQYILVEGSSIVPGTFLPDRLEWSAEITSQTPEIFPNDNTTEFELQVGKSWHQIVPVSELVSLYNHVVYDKVLVNQMTSSAPERTFDLDEIVVSVFQVPVYEVPGMTLSSYPLLTVEFCIIYSEPNCKNDSALIEGAIRIKSYEFTKTIAQKTQGFVLIDDPSAENLQDQSANLSYGLSAGGRFVDEDPDHCQTWITKMAAVGEASQCAGRFEVYSEFDQSVKHQYAWVESELLGLLIFSKGGRSISCGLDAAICIVDPNGKPGIYHTEGKVNYEVIFYDDELLRLGSDPLFYPYEIAFDIYNQQISSFQEPEQNN